MNSYDWKTVGLIVMVIICMGLAQGVAHANDRVTPEPPPGSVLFLSFIAAGDYYEMACPQVNPVTVCDAGGGGLTPIKKRPTAVVIEVTK
jgi:hypothetical protein